MKTLLEFKLDILKLEIQTINSAILDKDEASRRLKTWAVTLWTAATTLTGAKFLGQLPGNTANRIEFYDASVPIASLWSLATIAIPAAFLVLEVYNRRVQRKFIWRAGKLSEFLNDRGPSISMAFQDNDFGKFRIYDPAGENSRREIGGAESRKFSKFIGFMTVVQIPNIFVLYALLTALSVLLSIAITVTGWK